MLQAQLNMVVLLSNQLIQQYMTQKNQTALQKMQDIANRLISNTPQLAKMLDSDSALKPKKPNSPTSKKNKLNQSTGLHAQLGYSKNQMTANDYHQKCKELNNELQSSREKCLNLQEQINIIKQRFVEREIQYRKIIEELQDQIKSKSSLDSNDRNRMVVINDLHKEIIDNIGAIQNKTSKILIEQQSDIRRFFHKKINEIKDKFKEDKISKTQKDQEYQQKEKQMISELEWIKNIAHKIDQENKTLMKKYTSLKSEFDIQEKDKDLLLKELLMKKKENAVLKSQVQQYEKLLNEVSKEMEDNEVKSDLELNRLKSNELQQSNSQLYQSKADQVQIRRYEKTIAHLNNVIVKEKRKIRDLKNLYMKQIGSKSQLEKIIRKLVDDVRESIIQIQKDRNKKKRTNQDFSIETREQLLERILANQKILTLIYDKTFYSGQRNGGPEEVPNELQKILEDDQQEGFH